MSLKIHAIPALRDNYIYILSNLAGECAILDPGEAAPTIRWIREQGLKPKVILCTHHHNDHILGVPEIQKEFSLPVWTSDYDFPRIPGATLGLRPGDVIDLLGVRAEVIGVPGHTLGQIAFWLPNQLALFSGDTLFSCSCGRLFEGTYEQMHSTLQKLSSLPPETKIYFGHEYTLRSIQFLEEQGMKSEFLTYYREECEKNGITTPALLATELKINPFLTAKTVEEFQHWRELRNNWQGQLPTLVLGTSSRS